MAEITFGNLAFGQQLVLHDGDIATPESSVVVNEGSIVVASGATATLALANKTIKGSGKIFVDESANLSVRADGGAGNLEGVTLTNGGQLEWVGPLLCGGHFVMENYGSLSIDSSIPNIINFFENGELNESALRAAILELNPDTRAVFILREGVINGSGVFNGGLQLAGGRLKLGAPVTPEPPIGNGDGTVLTPTPSPDYMIVMGDVSTANGTIEVEITPTYYGQMSVAGTAILGGGGLTVALNGYTPAYAEAYRILRCTNITGQFASFNTTANNFDNKGIIAIPDNLKAYRLSGY